MYYLYKITNNKNGKIYVGQSNNPKRRWTTHKRYAQKPEETGQYIHRAMSKYGSENFTFEVIASCNTQDEADKSEEDIINQYNSRNPEFGYNIKPGGATRVGYKHSQESKEKMSQIRLGKYKGEENPFYGKTHSEEVKEKLSKLRSENPGPMTGKYHSVETIEKIKKARANQTIRHSEETKKKMSDAAKRRNASQ